MQEQEIVKMNVQVSAYCKNGKTAADIGCDADIEGSLFKRIVDRLLIDYTAKI